MSVPSTSRCGRSQTERLPITSATTKVVYRHLREAVDDRGVEAFPEGFSLFVLHDDLCVEEWIWSSMIISYKTHHELMQYE